MTTEASRGAFLYTIFYIAKQKGWKAYYYDNWWRNYAESDPSTVENISINESEISNAYTLDGLPTKTLRKGLNIIKMSDGTTTKVIIK